MPKTKFISPGSIPNHTLLENLQLNDKYISNDGGDEGIKIDDSGNINLRPQGADIFDFLYDRIKMKSHVDDDDYFEITFGSGGVTTLKTYGDPDINEASLTLQPDGNLIFLPSGMQGIVATAATKTSSGTTDATFSLNETLDLSSGAGGSDNHFGLKYTQTQTNIAGWDNIYLMYLDSVTSQFKVDDKAQLYLDLNPSNTGTAGNKGIHIDMDSTGNLGSGGVTLTNIGLDLDITRTGTTSHGSSTVTQTGIDLDLVCEDDGTSSNTGIDIFVSGADVNTPIKIRGGPLSITEQASAPTHVSGQGLLWVDDSTPTDLYFTDDTGNDIRITSGGRLHTASGVAADDISVGDAAISIATSSGDIVFKSNNSSGTEEWLTFKTSDMTWNKFGYNATNNLATEIHAKSGHDLVLGADGVGNDIILRSDDGSINLVVDTNGGNGNAIRYIVDTTPTPSASWQADQTHVLIEPTSTSGSGVGSSFNISTNGDGSVVTVAVASGGKSYAASDTIVLTDPGSTSSTATITVESIGLGQVLFSDSHYARAAGWIEIDPNIVASGMGLYASDGDLRLGTNGTTNAAVTFEANQVQLSTNSTRGNLQGYTDVRLGDRAFVGNSACNKYRIRLDGTDATRVFQISDTDVDSSDGVDATAWNMANAGGFRVQVTKTNGNTVIDTSGNLTLDAEGGTLTLKNSATGSADTVSIQSVEDIEIGAQTDIVLDSNGGHVTLLDNASTYTPTAASDATTKTYVDSQTIITGSAYNARIDNTTWVLMNQAASHILGGTDYTVGDEEDTGLLSSFDMRCLLCIVPFNMTVHAVSGSVFDDDMTTDVDKRIGIWKLPALGVSGADPGNNNPDTFTLAYITDAFGCTPGRAGAFYDTSADFALTAGDGIFMGYLNPQSAGNDDVTLAISIWAHQTTP